MLAETRHHVKFCRLRARPAAGSLKRMRSRSPLLWLTLAALVSSPRPAVAKEEMLPDISGHYQFLTADDTLGILEEEGRLRGYVDVVQGDDESDDILSYAITAGTRRANQVEFTTKAIHRKYYRFSGRVERGQGNTESDPDYLRLVGSLEIVTVNGETGEESVQRMNVIFKSSGPQRQEAED